MGFDVAVGLMAVPRGEGDYLVASTGSGYAVLGLALVVLLVSVATLPRPGPAMSARPSDGKAPAE